MNNPPVTQEMDLLPCPFCGHAPTLERWPARVFDAEPERFMVTCENEGDDAHQRCPLEGSFMEREEWNRRAPLPSFLPSPSEPEELAAELRALPSHYRYFSDTLNADDYYRMVAEALIARGYSKRSSPSSSEPKDCSTCDGRGWLPETVCCGNTSDSGGACKGECAEQIQSMCADCEGSGKELPASPSSAGQEVREALTALAEYARSSWKGRDWWAEISRWRDEYCKTHSPALSAGETETRT